MKTYRTTDELAYMRGILHLLKPKISAEIGVYGGGSAQVIKEECGELHLFDTFEGIIDEQILLEERERYKAGDYKATLKDAQQFLGEDGIYYYQGDIMKTKEQVKDSIFNFVHIDLDIYRPLNDCLPFFYKRLSGVMLVSNYDDYHSGVKMAVDEFNKPFKRYGRFVCFQS